MHMKRLVPIIALLAMAIPSGAQTIQKGNKFFNGETLYTVQEIRMGTIVYMTGENSSGDYLELTLEKVPDKAGEYTLQPSVQADDSPFPGAGFGDKVQYIRQQGMNFLAVSSYLEGLAEILVLTPDNLKNCLGQQEFAENQNLTELAGMMLLNRPLLDAYDTSDLVDLLGGPLKKDNPTVIERYNRQLVEGVIAFRNAQVMFGNPDGLGADGRGEDEIVAEEAVKDRVNQIFKDLARRNAGGEGNPTPEEFERKYTSALWLWTVKEVMRKDEKQDGINFYDHDYWTFSQDPSPDIKVQKIDVDEIDEGRATVFVRFVNWPGDEPQTMWLELVMEDGELKVNNIRDYDQAFYPGHFDYMKEMMDYLDPEND